jgi:putative ABC transport system ATP-binding protein
MMRLEFQNVSYRHDGKDILRNISIGFSAGDYVSIVGPSGSGKSTFLRLCCHLISPTGGRLLLNGKDMLLENPVELRKKIAYCFQTPTLFGDTVQDNVAFPYGIRGQKIDTERVSALFARFCMKESCLAQEIRTLSGGEKQRIALIRTLLFKPEILLLDEVTSALDAENAAVVENAILGLNREGITVLWVTHNDAQSKRYADMLLTLENGQIKSTEALK